jgi:hypothetical protein
MEAAFVNTLRLHTAKEMWEDRGTDAEGINDTGTD